MTLSNIFGGFIFLCVFATYAAFFGTMRSARSLPFLEIAHTSLLSSLEISAPPLPFDHFADNQIVDVHAQPPLIVCSNLKLLEETEKVLRVILTRW